MSQTYGGVCVCVCAFPSFFPDGIYTYIYIYKHIHTQSVRPKPYDILRGTQRTYTMRVDLRNEKKTGDCDRRLDI